MVEKGQMALVIVMGIVLVWLLYVTYFYPHSRLRIPIKGLCSILFILIGTVSVAKSGMVGPYSIAIIQGLFFSAIGDVLLGFADQKEIAKNSCFVFGVIAFSCAHSVYSTAFIGLGGWPPIVCWIVPFLVMIVFYLSTNNKWFDLKGHRRLLLGYCFIIGIMLMSGIYCSYSVQGRTQMLILLGSVLFVISDIILCVYYFYVGGKCYGSCSSLFREPIRGGDTFVPIKKYQIVSVINLLIYYVAQVLLALSVG